MISRRLIGREILFFLMLLFWGCSQPRPRIDDIPLPELSRLIDRAEANREALSDFRGEGLVIVRGPDANSALGINITYLQPDFLKLSLRNPMGVNAGALILAGGYYELTYIFSTKTSGKIADFNLAEDFGFPFTGEEIWNLFTPLIALERVTDDAVLMRDASLQLYSVSWTEGETKHQVWMDPFQPVAKRELSISAEGDTLWFREAKSFKKRADVSLPLSWIVQLGCGRNAYTMELKLSNLWVNRGVSPDEFKMDSFFESDSSEAHYDG